MKNEGEAQAANLRVLKDQKQNYLHPQLLRDPTKTPKEANEDIRGIGGSITEIEEDTNQ